MNRMNDFMKEELEKLQLSLSANSIGLQNVYNEFEKYKLSDISKKIESLNNRLDHYEKEKRVTGFELDISPFPMNIRIKLNITTNFGQIDYMYDYPPSLEYCMHNSIGSIYKRLLNDLYDAHDKRGGKYPGDDGCKAWFDENGNTVVHLEPMLSKRDFLK